MTKLPGHLDQAFRMAAAELGMCSAARLFVREIARSGGDELVGIAQGELGRTYPVLDFVAERWLEGERDLTIDPSPLVRALAGTSRALVIGLEADFLDALVPALKDTEIGLITEASSLSPDARRVLANYGGAVAHVGLSDFQQWAGKRSALVTFVYGSDGHTAHVSASWLRVSGPDVRTQFRSLVGWDILGRPMVVYPRWLVETSVADFSYLATGPRAPSRSPLLTPLPT